MPFSPVFAPVLSKPRRSAISDRRGFRIHDSGVRISLRTNTIRSPKPSPTGKVARASPASARRMRDKASLAEQGERQSPPFTQEGVARLCHDGGDCTFFKGVPQLPRFDNPSVKNQRFLPAVHCGMTATGSHGNFDSLRGAPPFTQGEPWVLPHQCVFREFP